MGGQWGDKIIHCVVFNDFNLLIQSKPAAAIQIILFHFYSWNQESLEENMRSENQSNEELESRVMEVAVQS